jgi:hypothetical protein
MGILMRMNVAIDAQIHTWLQQQFADQPISKMARLYNLPAATLGPVPDATPVAHGLHRFWPQ